MTVNKIWIVAENDQDGLLDSALELIAEGIRIAAESQSNASIVLLGYQLDHIVNAIKIDGIDNVYYLEHPLLENFTTDAYTIALTQLVKSHLPDLILISASTHGQDYAPRLALALGTVLVTDCVLVKVEKNGEIQYVKPTYADRIYTTFTSNESFPHIVTMRKNIIGHDLTEKQSPPLINKITPTLETSTIQSRFIRLEKGDPKSMDLNEAEIVVAGGRGAGDEQGWNCIVSLADSLGASVGGSRMAYDAGLIPKARMIGKTGKQIKPRLYFTAGISGSTYHVGGSKPGYWIAIDSDSSAPILKQADLGIVGDLNAIIPALVQKIKQIKDKQA